MFAVKPASQVAKRQAVVAQAQPAKSIRNAIKNIDIPAIVKPTATVAVMTALMAGPAVAGGGKLFDFNLTLPVMAGQFLLLMVFLEKTWFTPVGKVLDERDELIRSKLASVQGDTSKIAEMQVKAEQLLKQARDAATAAVNEARATTMAEQEAKLDTLRKQLDGEMNKALAELDRERSNAAASINEQASALAEEIMGRVLPSEPMPESTAAVEPSA